MFSVSSELPLHCSISSCEACENDKHKMENSSFCYILDVLLDLYLTFAGMPSGILTDTGHKNYTPQKSVMHAFL